MWQYHYEQLDELPYNTSGIYALLYKGEIIYIGQSQDIRKRLKRHYSVAALQDVKRKIQTEGDRPYRQNELRRYTFIQDHFYDVYWTILTQCSREELNKWEQYWIEKERPQFNWSGVVSNYIPVKREKAIVKLDKMLERIRIA